MATRLFDESGICYNEDALLFKCLLLILGQISFLGSPYKILPLIRSEYYFAGTHFKQSRNS